MDAFAAYCAQVVQCVRCKPDRPAIFAELTAHLEDHAAALRAGGLDEAEAALRAVGAMGDAEAVGKAMDRAHPPVWGWLLTLCHWLIYLSIAGIVVYHVYRFVGYDARAYFAPLVNLRSETAVLDIQKQLWDGEPVSTGAVTGGGWLGDYHFSPGGWADVCYLPAHTLGDVEVEARYCIELPVRISHWQPWLNPPSFYSLDYAMDQPMESAHLSNSFVGSDAHFSDWYLAAFYSPVAPGATSELTVSSEAGAVTFTVEWEGEP